MTADSQLAVQPDCGTGTFLIHQPPGKTSDRALVPGTPLALGSDAHPSEPNRTAALRLVQSSYEHSHADVGWKLTAKSPLRNRRQYMGACDDKQTGLSAWARGR